MITLKPVVFVGQGGISILGVVVIFHFWTWSNGISAAIHCALQ